jgi:hypothetical protein
VRYAVPHWNIALDARYLATSASPIAHLKRRQRDLSGHASRRRLSAFKTFDFAFPARHPNAEPDPGTFKMRVSTRFDAGLDAQTHACKGSEAR